MRRQNHEYILWLLCAVLAVTVVATAILENLEWRDRNIKATLAEPVVNEPGITADGRVNINTADMDTLMTVDGIGEKTAAKIIMYREVNGPFESVDDLMHIIGFGEKKLESLRPYLAAE